MKSLDRKRTQLAGQLVLGSRTGWSPHGLEGGDASPQVAAANAGGPLPALRALRPVLRISRIVRLAVRAISGVHRLRSRLRQEVAGSRRRFKEDGSDCGILPFEPMAPLG